MSNRPNRTGLPKTVASMMEDLKASASRPSIGVGNKNYFLYGQQHNLNDSLGLHARRLSFQTSESPAVTETRIFDESRKRPSDSGNSTAELMADPQVLSSVPKRLATSPGGIDWSPAAKEQRSRLLETVDSRITELQSMVSKNEEFKRQLQDVMDSERLAMQRQIEKDQSIIKHLQEQLEKAKDKTFEVEQELIKRKSKLREQKLDFDEQIRLLENEKLDMKKEYLKTCGELRSVQSSLGLKLQESQSKLELATSLSDSQAERIATLEKENARLAGREMQEHALKDSLKVAEQRIRTLEMQLRNAKATAVQQKTPTVQSATARRVRELEDQLAQTRELVRGKMLLEEQANTLRAQLATRAPLMEELAMLKESVKRKDAELDEWHALTCQQVSESGGSSSSGEVPSPRVLQARIQSLEQSVLVGRADLAETVSQLRGARLAKDELETKLVAERTGREGLQRQLELHTAALKRAERKLGLIAKERDSIQAVLAAYEGDVTVAPGQLATLQRARLEAAERSVQELRTMLEEREAQAARGTEVPSAELAALQDKFKVAEQELTRERTRRAVLEERVEQLEVLLEQRAIQGDFDTAGTKVLHFKMNPVAHEEERQRSELEQLQRECDRLRERVRVLEAARQEGTSTANTTLMVEEGLQIRSNKELTEAREKVKQLETKQQRLMECYKKSSHNFRQAVYMLLGYKMDGLNDNTFRLLSLYAEQEEDCLLFKMLENDRIDVLHTPYMETVPEHIRAHLEEQGSLPAFLSALTLELYSHQTYTT